MTCEIDELADGHVAEQAAEGRGVGDELSVDGLDDVAGMDAGLGGGRVVVERDDFGAGGVGELLLLRADGIDVVDGDAEIALRRSSEDEAGVAVDDRLGKLGGDRRRREDGLHGPVGGQVRDTAAKAAEPGLTQERCRTPRVRCSGVGHGMWMYDGKA